MSQPNSGRSRPTDEHGVESIQTMDIMYNYVLGFTLPLPHVECSQPVCVCVSPCWPWIDVSNNEVKAAVT